MKPLGEIACPKCGTQYDPEAFLKTRRARVAAVPEKEIEPVVAEASTDEVATNEQSADPAEPVSDPEPEAEEQVWTKEVSFSRAPEPEPVAEQPVDEQIVAEAEPVANAVPALEEPIDTPIAASVEAEALVETWHAPPAMPPAPSRRAAPGPGAPRRAPPGPATGCRGRP